MSFIFEEEQKTNDTHTLLVEKYRPTKLENYIGNEQLKETVKSYINKKDIPHLLFFGAAGTGKTSLAKLITKNIPCDVLYINASDENSVDTVRTKIKGFASTTGFNPLKVIVLDECLDENTLVYILRSGVEVKVKIKDVDEKLDLVKSFNVKLNKIEWRPFYLLNVGDRDVVRIDLENGESVVCTEEHKWYVYDEFNNIIKVKTKELLNGKYNYILSPE